MPKKLNSKLKKYQKTEKNKANEVKSDTTTFYGPGRPGDFVLYPPGTSSKRGNVDVNEALRKALEKNPLPKNKKGGSSTKTKKKK